MADLLPGNATIFESNLSESIARISDVPTPSRDVWNPDLCPFALLPWLAWAFSADEWDPTWSEIQKRRAIKTAVAVQRHKGTIGSVADALRALGFTARIQEWFNQIPSGVPYTFRLLLEVDQDGFDYAALQKLLNVVGTMKNLRSHLDSVTPTVASQSNSYFAAVSVSGSEISYTQPAGVLALDGTFTLDGQFKINGRKILN